MAQKEYFPGIGKIKFEGKESKNPYKGKGIKYADEVIRRKVGKTGKK